MAWAKSKFEEYFTELPRMAQQLSALASHSAGDKRELSTALKEWLALLADEQVNHRHWRHFFVGRIVLIITFTQIAAALELVEYAPWSPKSARRVQHRLSLPSPVHDLAVMGVGADVPVLLVGGGQVPRAVPRRRASAAPGAPRGCGG